MDKMKKISGEERLDEDDKRGEMKKIQNFCSGSAHRPIGANGDPKNQQSLSPGLISSSLEYKYVFLSRA